MSARLRAIGRLLGRAAAGVARTVVGTPNMQDAALYDLTLYDAGYYCGDDVVGRYDETYYDHCYYAPIEDNAARYDRDHYDERYYGE